MKKLVYRRINPEKELPILNFLWRWKVATTSAVFIRFEPTYNWKPFTAYQRMLRLREKGLVEAKLVSSRSFAIWTLTKSGFLAIREDLPILKEEGYDSETPEHDLYVLAAQFGDWLPRGTVNDVAFFTEQELRRQSDETLYDWLPPTKAHRPDGYWYFPKSKPKSVISLEIEINRKAFTDYMGYGNFYNKYKAIESVVWIVQSESLANKIVSAAHKNLGEFRDIHNFIRFKDFLKLGWQAKFFSGPAARSELGAFLNLHRSQQAESSPKTSRKRAVTSQILDQRLCRFNSVTYADSEIPPLR